MKFDLSLLVILAILVATDVSAQETERDFGSAALETFSDDGTELEETLRAIYQLESNPVHIREMSAHLMSKLEMSPEGATESFLDESLEGQAADLSLIAKQIEPDVRDEAAYLRFHLFDLILAMNPDDLGAVYDREYGSIYRGAIPLWADADLQEGPKGWVSIPLKIGSSPSVGEAIADRVPGLVRPQAYAVGLMVRQLGDSKFAGSASRMNATVLPNPDTSEWTASFNQEVGDMMKGGLARVLSFMESRHETVPKNVHIEMSFEDQYIPKDGPSASVACALLVESLLKGTDYDSGFAVTGDLSEAGAVGRVGGIDGKIRGAAAKGCHLVGIPAVNEYVVSDLLLLEGPRSISQIQIFKLETFEHALDLAKKEGTRSEALEEAIAEFAEIQRVINAPDGMRYLRNPQVRDRLRTVVQKAPHHLSARYLFLRSVAKDPAQLSLSGSLEAISRARAPLTRALREKKFQERASALNDDEYADTITLLTRLRSELDPRTLSTADALTEFAGHLRTYRENRPKSYNNVASLISQINRASDDVDREYEALFERRDIKEELELEDLEEDDDGDD